jgi:hypothetical protein
VALRRQWMMLGIPTNGWWLVTGWYFPLNTRDCEIENRKKHGRWQTK